MAQSNKPIKTAKLTGTKKVKFEKDFSDIQSHYQSVLDSWPNATEEQRRVFLENSPFLRSVIDWSNKWQL